MKFLYYFLAALCRLYFRLFRRLKVQGREHIPKDGPLIFASNHRSMQDPFILAPEILPRRMAFFAKKEIFVPLVAPVLRGLGTFPVDRRGDATGAIRASEEALGAGFCLGIFPEGTRNRGSEPTLPFKRGVTLIASRTGATVVPVAIRGSRGFFPRVHLTFLPPLTLEAPQGGRVSKEDTARFLQELRHRIGEAL